MLRELYARLEICSTIRTDLCHEYQKAAKGYEKLSLNEAAAAKFEGGAAGLLKKASLSTKHIGPTPKPLQIARCRAIAGVPVSQASACN